MMWMLLGLGSAFAAGATTEPPAKDSMEAIDLRRNLPVELRERLDRTREEMRLRRDSLSRLSPQERAQWLDSLRREAKERKLQALEKLTPEERARVEERLRELERKVQLRKQALSNPGYRQ